MKWKNWRKRYDKRGIPELPSVAQKGYGSVMMEAILHFARRQNPIRQVSGWLAPGDLKSHGERLLHFYQKFGFSMTDLEEGKQITLDLS